MNKMNKMICRGRDLHSEIMTGKPAIHTINIYFKKNGHNLFMGRNEKEI